MTPSTSQHNILGAAWMTAAMLGYVVNDAFIKLVAEDVPLFQAVFLRGLVVTAILVAISAGRGELDGFRQLRNAPLLLRIAMETSATVLYLLALTNLPIADVTAVLQTVPLAVTFAAARLLREPVSLARLGAVGLGFGGVLLIVRPGSDEFSPWFLAAFAAVVVIVVRELATKHIPSGVPSALVALGTAVSITAMGGVVSVVEGWGEISIAELALLVGAALFLTLAYTASVITIRIGELSFSAPFRYTVLVFAIALQVVVFDDVPDATTFLGAGVIAAAGLWAFTRERAVIATVRRG